MTVLDDDIIELSEGMTGDLCITDKTGDTRIEWDKDDTVSVAAARAAFDASRKKGHLIYRTKRDGSKAEVMHTFDSTAERIVATPPTVGG